MKLLVLLPLSAALLFVGCGEKSSSEGSDSVGASAEPSADTDVERLLKEAVDMESLEERDDLSYQNNEPFSGWGKMMYDSGQVRGLVQLKDGKHDGLQTYWYKNGQKKDERTFKDGKLDGLWTSWRENGQKWAERTYKDGKPDGPSMMWHENGQKSAERTFKDGKPDGLWMSWHKNGQKQHEGTFKDGKVVDGSRKHWNSIGVEVETAGEAKTIILDNK